MKLALIILVVLVAAFAAYVRLVPDDPVRWNIDPATAADPGTRGVRIAPDTTTYPIPPADLMRRFNDVALAEPRTSLLAGSVADLHATYVARTKFWGFPDYITVKALPDGTGATLAIVSRLRFGGSDLGVNAARIDRWLKALDAVQ